MLFFRKISHFFSLNAHILIQFIVLNVFSIFSQAQILPLVLNRAESTDVKIPLEWENRLFSATYIQKLIIKEVNFYFIVDCWHHRVLFLQRDNPLDSHALETLSKTTSNQGFSLSEWQTLDAVNLFGPHSLATDGKFLVIDNTGVHSLNLYEPTQLLNGQWHFQLVKTISDIGFRPHRTHFDESLKKFVVVSSGDNSIYNFDIQGQLLKINLPTKKLAYIRSMTILKNGNYAFTSGDSEILITDNKGNRVNSYSVLPQFASMNDIFELDHERGFIISTTPQRLIFTPSLQEFSKGNYVDLFNQLQLKGTPYYVSYFDDRLWIPEITEYTRLIGYNLNYEESSLPINSPLILFDFGLPSIYSFIRKVCGFL